MEAREASIITGVIAEKYGLDNIEVSGWLHNALDPGLGPESNQKARGSLNHALDESDVTYLLGIWADCIADSNSA
ncbi:hypothetical protein COW99_01555 [Candidatus Roizmanbacteria bacterium CG22_combo_CG10-13_8_21_14_all_38_20]|uniref:Uncharacterized protein n=1 Tax=Candidatus Roizmanbacteria bacterium CG22_combo_CG10-13_8_21_14_all_38_20 TaxID=1974862 RepID=A0A2H0BW80_9BACT|nr:hypothetical protein [Candidatus Microgenomates bacterium]PIP61891.1 MAG: hypothetical protein COW99_01555 [Candidatus Roizmanbacteria bacterium CG22_combo_CG10-13_8_21_14_all_38_20]PJC32134.1 MAG: hypothetical protein CO050_01400 [Candidatus Roizmanbacteria bacterium CG_4_9_14_0_2_um_filter_38_17]